MTNDEISIFLGILILFFMVFFIVYLSGVDTHTPKEKKKLTLQEQYQLLLQMPEWKEKRLQIIKRDGYRCQWCNTTNNLQVHHKWYCKTKNGLRRNPWDYDDNVFMTLCDHCHKRYHEKYEVKTFCCGCTKYPI